MAGRRPIFLSLISSLIWGTRDFLFKALLEPASHEDRKKKDKKKKK
jgi:hypothetical protein